MHLFKNDVNELSFKNVRLFTDADKETVIKYILRLENLEYLQLVSNTQRLYMNSFNDIFERLLTDMPGPMEKIVKALLRG